MKMKKKTELDCIERFRDDFIDRLVEYKRKNRLGHEDLAKMIGCNACYISILLSRVRPLKMETMVRILGVLGLDVCLKIVKSRKKIRN